MEEVNSQVPAPGDGGPERRLAETLAENARLWQEVHRLRAERREVDYYERLAQQVTSSLSWRITTPLRSGKAVAAKARRKLAERDS
jgi:hypothetical protein